jgi:hypothetical protein
LGFFNFVKILNLKEFSSESFKNGGETLPKKSVKNSTAFFFLFHYGFFHFIYANFLGIFSLDSFIASNNYLQFLFSGVTFLSLLFDYIIITEMNKY